MTRGPLHPTSTRRTSQTRVAVDALAIIGDTLENCQVETLEKLTEGFQKLPDPQLGQSARERAVQNVSFEKFTFQLTALLKSFY